MPTITPFLWFDHEALEAAKFYVSVFKGDSRITAIHRYSEAGPGPAGSVMTVAFRLRGVPFTALNGGPHFKFTEAISFVVHCNGQAEIDRIWRKLTSRGGRPVQCGWLKDRYGLSWQIVPKGLNRLLGSKDPKRTARVMKAVFGMKKLNAAALKAAFAG